MYLRFMVSSKAERIPPQMLCTHVYAHWCLRCLCPLLASRGPRGERNCFHLPTLLGDDSDHLRPGSKVPVILHIGVLLTLFAMSPSLHRFHVVPERDRLSSTIDARRANLGLPWNRVFAASHVAVHATCCGFAIGGRTAAGGRCWARLRLVRRGARPRTLR